LIYVVLAAASLALAGILRNLARAARLADNAQM